MNRKCKEGNFSAELCAPCLDITNINRHGDYGVCVRVCECERVRARSNIVRIIFVLVRVVKRGGVGVGVLKMCVLESWLKYMSNINYNVHVDGACMACSYTYISTCLSPVCVCVCLCVRVFARAAILKGKLCPKHIPIHLHNTSCTSHITPPRCDATTSFR